MTFKCGIQYDMWLIHWKSDVKGFDLSHILSKVWLSVRVSVLVQLLHNTGRFEKVRQSSFLWLGRGLNSWWHSVHFCWEAAQEFLLRTDWLSQSAPQSTTILLFLTYFTVVRGQWTTIWEQWLTILMGNNHQLSVYHTFVLRGSCPVLKPTAPDREKCLTVERNKMNNYSYILWWCFHGPNKCSIRALIGSRNHSVTSAAESRLPTEWWVIGRDLASESRERWQA